MLRGLKSGLLCAATLAAQTAVAQEDLSKVEIKLYPFIDTSSGGTVEGVIAAADRVLEMSGDKTRIIPGHGPLATAADLKVYRDMLAAVSGQVRSQIKQGRKLEEVVASKPTAPYDKVWSHGFLPPEKFVAMLYGNLTRKE
jgi:hypothetical protein